MEWRERFDVNAESESRAVHGVSEGNFIDLFAPTDAYASRLTYPPVPALAITMEEAATVIPETVLYSPTELDLDYGYRNLGEASGVVDGSLVVYRIETIGLLPLTDGCGTWTFTLGDGGYGGWGIIPAGEIVFVEPEVATFTISIVPEPANALLLLVGVPLFGRRRRRLEAAKAQ